MHTLSACLRWVFSAGLIVAVIGCMQAWQPTQPTERHPPGFPLAPSTDGRNFNLVQILRAIYQTGQDEKPKLYQVQSVVQQTPERLKIIAMGPLGTRLLTLVWDGVTVEAETAVTIPAAITPQDLLVDYQLVHWRTEALAAAFPAGEWALSILTNGDRELYYRQKRIITVTYDRDHEGRERARLINHAYRYELISLLLERQP